MDPENEGVLYPWLEVKKLMDENNRMRETLTKIKDLDWAEVDFGNGLRRRQGLFSVLAEEALDHGA
jgi:hypothetical protein